MYIREILVLCILTGCIIPKTEAECPSGTLQDIMIKATVEIASRDIVGKWYAVITPVYQESGCPLSYSSFTQRRGDGDTLDTRTVCFSKPNPETPQVPPSLIMDIRTKMARKTMGKLKNSKKGIYTLEVPTEKGFRTVDVYFFYQDQYVIAYYTCLKSTSRLRIFRNWWAVMLYGGNKNANEEWNIGILVKNRDELIDTARKTNTKASLDEAKKALRELERKNNLYVERKKRKFGIIGPTKSVDNYEHLRFLN